LKVYFNFDTGKFHYSFSKDTQYFNEIVSLLKTQYHCNYSPKYHEWQNSNAIVIENSITDLKAYDTVTISKEDLELLNDMLFPIDSSYKKIKRVVNKEWLAKYPPIIGKHPYEDYQLDTIKYTLNRNRAILSLKPGTGKSYIGEAVLASIPNISNKKIIWCNRLEGQSTQYFKILQFLSDFYNEDDIVNLTTENREIENYFDKKVVVTNYTTMKLSNEYYYKQKMKNKAKGHKPSKSYIDFNKWGKPEELILILDECQAVKNSKSLQSNYFQYFSSYFDYRYLLSGSLGYKILDYYSLCKILIPESVPYSYSEFRDYISVKGTYGNQLIPQRVKKFKEKVIDTIQVSYDENVLELKPFIEKEVFVEMSTKMRKMYKDYIDTTINTIECTKDKINLVTLEASFNSLLSFTSDPILLDFPDWNFSENPKIEIVSSMLERFIDDENRKVVLWSNHPKVINELAKVYSKYKPIVIHGDESTSVKREERDNLISDFRNNPDKYLLICSYVLNSSIDLYEATREIYFDNITDNDKRDQSKKRLWRLGQKDSVESYYLLFNHSIDLYCYYEILCRKNKVRNLLMEKEVLSLEDYAKVLNAKVEYYWKDTD
jgi:SNF2 family DNA or RNA helicase